MNDGNLKTSGTDVPGNALSLDSNLSFVDQGGGAEYRLGAGVLYHTNFPSVSTEWQAHDVNIKDWPTTQNDKADALEEGNYMAVGLTAVNDLAVSELAVDLYLNGSGSPRKYAIYTSVNGGAFVQAGSDVDVGSISAGDGTNPNAICTVSASDLNIDVPAGQTLEIQLYAWIDHVGSPSEAANTHVIAGSMSGVISSGLVQNTSTYDSWAAGAGVTGSMTEDDDGDGLDNLAEYALGGSPSDSSDRGVLPVLETVGGDLKYVHVQRSDDDSLVYSLERSESLVAPAWTNAGYIIVGTNVTGGTFNYVTNSIPTTNDTKFIRLKIDG